MRNGGVEVDLKVVENIATPKQVRNRFVVGDGKLNGEDHFIGKTRCEHMNKSNGGTSADAAEFDSSTLFDVYAKQFACGSTK